MNVWKMKGLSSFLVGFSGPLDVQYPQFTTQSRLPLDKPKVRRAGGVVFRFRLL